MLEQINWIRWSEETAMANMHILGSMLVSSADSWMVPLGAVDVPSRQTEIEQLANKNNF
jgi:hypothetical protein